MLKLDTWYSYNATPAHYSYRLITDVAGEHHYCDLIEYYEGDPRQQNYTEGWDWIPDRPHAFKEISYNDIPDEAKSLIPPVKVAEYRMKGLDK